MKNSNRVVSMTPEGLAFRSSHQDGMITAFSRTSQREYEGICVVSTKQRFYMRT